MEMKLVERNARARVFLLASLRPASGAAQGSLAAQGGEERRERGCCTRVARAHSQPTLSVPAAAPRRAKSYAQRFGGPVPLGSCTARLPLLLPRLSACLPAAEESALLLLLLLCAGAAAAVTLNPTDRPGALASASPDPTPSLSFLRLTAHCDLHPTLPPSHTRS